jgi:hypothetical protein
MATAARFSGSEGRTRGYRGREGRGQNGTAASPTTPSYNRVAQVRAPFKPQLLTLQHRH